MPEITAAPLISGSTPYIMIMIGGYMGGVR